MIFAVTCPFCGKRMRVSLSQLLFRSRFSVGCPKCGRQVFAAVKTQMMTLYILEGVIAVLLFYGAAKLGVGGSILTMTLLLITLVALFEGLFRILFRDQVLYTKTVEYLKLENQLKASQAAAAKEAEQKAKRHPQKK